MPKPQKQKPKSRVKQTLYQYDKWVKFQKNIREDDVRRNKHSKAIADFLKRVLPPTISVSPTNESDTQTPAYDIKTEPSTNGMVYETPKRQRIESDGDDTVIT